MNEYLFALLVFVIAFPFGFWRARVKFRSRQWMLAVHIPVVFIILGRIFFKTPFSWSSLVLNVIAFFIAQFLAGVIYKKFLLK